MTHRNLSQQSSEDLTSSDVLHANQLFYTAQASEYDKKNYVQSQSIQRYYQRLFEEHIFLGSPVSKLAKWRVLDVGCGTGFLEKILVGKVDSIFSMDATFAMVMLARQNLQNEQIVWLQADALRLPYKPESFDLVCSNALLHHMYDFEGVLSEMVSLLAPGGKLFLGYEPNAIPYRFFRPFLLALSRIVPEHKHQDKIREASGQDSHPRLKKVNIHRLSEYHIFHGKGIHPFRLEQFLWERGIVNTRVHFTSLYQAALLRDSGIPFPVDSIPEWLFRLTGRMSLSFSLTGTKRSE